MTSMKARIKWVEDRTFVGESGSGHKIVLGTAAGAEERTPGPSPMELVLIGTGGCAAFDVVHILEKGREAIEDCVVELNAERAETDPKVFTRIHMHFVVKGSGLAPGKCSAPSTCRSRNIARRRQCWPRRSQSPTPLRLSTRPPRPPAGTEGLQLPYITEFATAWDRERGYLLVRQPHGNVLLPRLRIGSSRGLRRRVIGG
jgi:putative redox protein